MKKMIFLTVMICCVVAFTGPAIATNLTIDDLIGTVVPGSPASPVDERAYLNQLLAMYNEGTPASPFPSGGHIYTLIVGDNVPDPDLPLATGGVQQMPPNLDVTTPYLYILGKFGNSDAFYYLGSQTGTIDSIYVPASFGSTGIGLSHITLFNATPTSVPEPASLLLLGLGIVGVGIVRRFKKC